MATASEILDIARREIGYYALDDPEPGSKYGRWMAKLLGEDWLAGPSTSVWWCCNGGRGAVTVINTGTNPVTVGANPCLSIKRVA